MPPILGNTTTTGENAAAPLNGSELVRGVQSGGNVKMTTAAIAALGYASPTAATGDLIVRGGGADQRFAVGADGTQLVADSTHPLGVKWYDAVGALAANYATAAGAGELGVADSSGAYQATTVEGVLAEIASLAYSTNVLSLIPTSEWSAILGGTSTYDGTAAVNAAAAKAFSVFFPAKINVTSQINVPSTCGEFIGWDMYASGISKKFNGDAIKCDTSGFRLIKFGIDGNGATYSGGGIRPRGYNILIHQCRINDTADCPIIVEPSTFSSGALAATYLRVDSCFLKATNPATTYAARCTGADSSTSPTVRVFTNITGGSSLIDFSGMNYGALTDSLGTIIAFDANSSKITVTGNRFTNTTNLTVYGANHVIDDNNWGFDAGHNITIDSSASGIHWGPTNDIVINSSTLQSPIDGSAAAMGANPNNIHSNLNSFAFGWFGSTTNPTLGNSTTYSFYHQSGRRCYATFGLAVGNSGVAGGSGTYTFQLPFKAYVNGTGVARIKTSGGVFHNATIFVAGNSNVCTVYIEGASSAFNDGSIAFGNNATIDCSIDYLIAAA